MIKFWSYKREYSAYKNLFIKKIKKTLNTGTIFFGKELEVFEKTFKKKYKSKYGLAVRTGTDALLISLKAIGVKKGDEIITAANTAIPTISAIINAGCVPKLADIGEDYLLDLASVKKQISSKTKVIIPVHLYGQSCDMDKIKISEKLNKIIENMIIRNPNQWIWTHDRWK